MTTLTFYGGVNEIGGNKILLEDKKTKIFLDFGMSFGSRGMFFEEYLKPRSANGLGDFLKMGLVPDLNGVYRDDLLGIIGRKTKDCEIDGVLISHAHADHANYISFLHENIPVHCGKTAHLLLQAICESGQSGLENEMLGFKERPILKKKAPVIEREFKHFRTGDEFKIKSLEVKPIHVDHSLPGAYGYIIYTSAGPVVYTGDFRFHGMKSEMSNEFIEKAAEENPVAMICEGTTFGRKEKEQNTEEDVYQECFDVISKSDKFVTADFNFKDADRIQTFYRIAKETGRKFVITFKDACFLKWLAEDEVLKKKLPNINDEHIVLYKPKKSKGLYRDQDYSIWEREYLDMDNVWKAEDVNENQKNVIMAMTFYQITELIDIKPSEESIWIQAHSEPFNEEMGLDQERLENWLRFFKFQRVQSHASGHASPEEIKSAISKVKPKKLYLVHTEEPVLYTDYLKDLDLEIINPEQGNNLQV